MESEIKYEPVEQPPLKPLEPGWWEDDALTSHNDATERALRDGEAQRLQDAEERNY